VKVVVPHLKTWLLAAALALVLPLPSQGREEVAASSPTNSAVTGRPFRVDMAWAGTGVAYDAIAVGDVVYVAYYDDERRLCVTRIDTRTGKRTKKTLDSRFKGWDAHNYLTLAHDRFGYLHVAGNMHAAPLVYARMLRPNDFDSLTLINRMVGKDEASVTYPKFFRFPNGDLGFTYRSGSSGQGAEWINRFSGSTWTRVLSTPLFASAPGEESVSAYHTSYTIGPDGLFHTAWVWRKTPDVATNFNVNYARSKDLKHWETSRGEPLTVPLTPRNAEVVDRVPVNGGLLNNVKLAFDPSGAPIIAYIRYDNGGNTQLYHARLQRDGWQVAPATRWDYRWELKGGGSIVGKITFSGVRLEDGKMIEEVKHVRYGRKRLVLDPHTLAGSPAPPARPKARALGRPVKVTAPYRMNTRTVRAMENSSLDAVIRWRSFGTENNDRRRTCASSGLQEGCAMTSELELFVR
jgi:hypothetical protein